MIDIRHVASTQEQRSWNPLTIDDGMQLGVPAAFGQAQRLPFTPALGVEGAATSFDMTSIQKHGGGSQGRRHRPPKLLPQTVPAPAPIIVIHRVPSCRGRVDAAPGAAFAEYKEDRGEDLFDC